MEFYSFFAKKIKIKALVLHIFRARSNAIRGEEKLRRQEFDRITGYVKDEEKMLHEICTKRTFFSGPEELGFVPDFMNIVGDETDKEKAGV